MMLAWMTSVVMIVAPFQAASRPVQEPTLMWSPYSAYTLGPRNGIRVGTAIEGQRGIDLPSRYAPGMPDAMYIGGTPNVAYHRGSRVGFEFFAGARFTLGWVALGGTPLLLGFKQALIERQAGALAIRFEVAPWESTPGIGSTLPMRTDVIGSIRLAERFTFDIATGLTVRKFWGGSPGTLHALEPFARLGATYARERIALSFGAEGSASFNFLRFATPVPSPYILTRYVQVGVYFGFAWHGQ
jgi:hypothetical protein